MELDNKALSIALDALKRKHQELRIAIEHVKTAQIALSVLIDAPDPTRDESSRKSAPDPVFENMSIPEAAEYILREAARPIHFREIMARMQARGFRADQDTQSLRLSLVGALARKAREGATFVSAGHGVYSLAAWEEPAGTVRADNTRTEKTSAAGGT